MTPAACLFERWRHQSAPIFHTSRFWPSFDIANVKQFLHTDTPNIAPSTALNVAGAREAKRQIETFMADTHALPNAEHPCKSAYLAFEEERLATLEIILNDGDVQAVEHYNDALYGTMSDLYYDAALSYLKGIVMSLTPKCSVVVKAQDLLLASWKDIAPSDQITALCDQHERYRQQLESLIEEKFNFIPILISNQTEFDSKTTATLLQASFEPVLGSKSSRWTAIVKDNAINAHIDNQNCMVVIPANRHFSRNQVRNLIVHEIGVHIRRSVNGVSSHEPLAGYGMAGYSIPEEALGVLLGSTNMSAPASVHRLISLAICQFADGNHSFREVYTLTRALLVCLANPEEAAYEANNATYNRQAFNRTIRMLRLGTGTLVDRSATKYWGGLLLMSKYFESHPINQATLDELLLGKYNPFSAQQLSLIKHHTIS